MEYISEQLSTPILGNYDVIVCGGGVAGVAAAVSAARCGVTVLLIEKSIQFGGLATLGLISWYEPICDGEGSQLMYGMAEEILRLSIRYADHTLDSQWLAGKGTKEGSRYATFFSPAVFSMALDRYLEDANVKVLLDTIVVSPIMDGGACKGVVVENKTGRGCYTADFFIDATGDGDLLNRAGIPCTLGENYLTFIGYLTDRKCCEKSIQSGNLLDVRKWVNSGSDLWGRGHPENVPKLSGTTAEEVTEFVMRGRRSFFDKYLEKPYGSADVTVLPSMAQLRTTRRLNGAYELTEADEGRHFFDSVSTAGDFANRGKRYEIPLRTLFHPDYTNIMTAGRCISSSGWAWEVTRVIPVAVATGQAAGAAAAICVQENKAIAKMPIEVLQSRLRQDGVRLFCNESCEKMF